MRPAVMIAALLPLLPSTLAVYKGFNYGSTFSDGSAKGEADFQGEFESAQALVGNSGFNSARLYTMIQEGTTNTPTGAIQAAVNTKTTLLLGLWASAGDADFENELEALTTAISQYGSAFTDLIAGISVGSEDLYRISPTGLTSPNAAAGAEPSTIVSYISRVRSAIAGGPAKGAKVGHVDTWTAWVNGSNNIVTEACDFIGMDAYPYYQTTMANSIQDGQSLFESAFQQTQAAVGGKPVWITETGWPVCKSSTLISPMTLPCFRKMLTFRPAGPTSNQAVPSIANAKAYWDEVGCSLFGSTNTWWYTLQDVQPTDNADAPSFGVVGAGNPPPTSPLYDLSC